MREGDSQVSKKLITIFDVHYIAFPDKVKASITRIYIFQDYSVLYVHESLTNCLSESERETQRWSCLSVND